MQEQKSNPKRHNKDSRNGAILRRDLSAFVVQKRDRADVLKALKSKDLIERQVAYLDRTN
jgi:hypothetical protein